MENEKISRKNKAIITVAVLSLVIATILYVLCNSTFNGTFSFRFLTNTRTGEQIGIMLCLIYYAFVGTVFGMLFSSCVIVFTIFLYFGLHIKDKNLFHRHYSPPYEDELFYGCEVARISGFLAVAFLVLLDASGLITIHIF